MRFLFTLIQTAADLSFFFSSLAVLDIAGIEYRGELPDQARDKPQHFYFYLLIYIGASPSWTAFTFIPKPGVQ